MRCFFGIEISNNVKLEVKGLIRKYKSINFTKLDNIHITLKFMDVITDVQGLIKAAEEVNIPKFTINLKSVGAFPNKDFARILWLGVGEGNEEVRMCCWGVLSCSWGAGGHRCRLGCRGGRS